MLGSRKLRVRQRLRVDDVMAQSIDDWTGGEACFVDFLGGSPVAGFFVHINAVGLGGKAGRGNWARRTSSLAEELRGGERDDGWRRGRGLLLLSSRLRAVTGGMRNGRRRRREVLKHAERHGGVE